MVRTVATLAVLATVAWADARAERVGHAVAVVAARPRRGAECRFRAKPNDDSVYAATIDAVRVVR